MRLLNSYFYMLGGWHRLWIVFSGLSLAFLLATTTLYVEPMPESYSFRNEFYDALSSESKNKILEINVFDEPKALSNSFLELVNPKSEWLVTSNTKGKLKDSILVTMPNNQIIAFKKEQYGDSMKEACQEYWGIIEKYAHKQKKINPILISMLSNWLILCTFLYGFGISVAWVRQGFKNDA